MEANSYIQRVCSNKDNSSVVPREQVAILVNVGYREIRAVGRARGHGGPSQFELQVGHDSMYKFDMTWIVMTRMSKFAPRD